MLKQIQYDILQNYLGLKNMNYSEILTITTARVPIITFFHVPSGLYCNLSFKSGLSVYNTKLIK